MALSDDLRKLSDRAKEAEDHAAGVKTKAKADLEADVENARAVAQAQADNLSESANAPARRGNKGEHRRPQGRARPRPGEHAGRQRRG